MNCYIVGVVGVPSSYGGFETLVENLVVRKNDSNINYTVFCSKYAYKKCMKSYYDARLVYIPLKANGFQSIFYDILSMIKSIKNSDVVLILGVSGCIFLPIFKLFSRAKIIVNIDGLEHKRGKWNVFIKKYLKYSERLALKFSNIVIADNKAIAEYVYSEYKVKAEVIAYGGDHVEKIPLSKTVEEKFGVSSKYAFKVCRIEPENNIEMILEAFSIAKSLSLVVVGNWNSSDYGIKLRTKYSTSEFITMLDPIYESKTLNQLRSNCLVYVHGHSAGGTNPSLVEAMNLRLPIFCYDVVYNKETTKYSALYFKSSDELVDLLKSIDSFELDKFAGCMEEIGKREYSWAKIVSSYEALYFRSYLR